MRINFQNISVLYQNLARNSPVLNKALSKLITFLVFFSFSWQRMVIWMPEARLKPETAHEKSLIPRAEYMKKSGFAFHLISRSSMIYNRVHYLWKKIHNSKNVTTLYCTCIRGGYREGGYQAFLVLLEFIAQALTDGCWCAAVNTYEIVLLKERNLTLLSLEELVSFPEPVRRVVHLCHM